MGGNVNRWFTTIVNQPQVKKVVGAIKLAEKMAQFDAKKFAEMQKETGAGSGKKDNKKQEKEKKEATPAAEEDEPLLPAEPKKDPMAAVPKGNFDMDDFKLFYSNNDEDKSIPYFWEKFDKENYSIWR